MLPTAIILSRYRAFRDMQRVPIAPITIIIGKNGGGKSVLTRLVLLLSAGLAKDAEAPINLAAGDVDHGSRFEDLSHKRSPQPFQIGAEISDGAATWRFRTSLSYVVERHSLAISGFVLEEDERIVCELELSTPEQLYSQTPQYKLKTSQDDEGANTFARFVGLFPDAVESNSILSGRLADIRGKFQSAFSDPSYLGPFRAEPTGLIRVPRQGIRSLGTRGEKAIELLGDDALRGNGELALQVEQWFNDNFQGTRVTLTQTADLPRLLVRDAEKAVDVDLTETGAGFAQVLPVVVQTLAKVRGQLPGTLLLMEQPELHLHPAAHGAVADLMVDAIASGVPARYMCETHSEQLIMRLRRRVAERRISPDKVLIVSVGHQDTPESLVEPLRLITLDENANPSSWPAGVFDEALVDLIGMREAIKAQSMSVER